MTQRPAPPPLPRVELRAPEPTPGQPAAPIGPHPPLVSGAPGRRQSGRILLAGLAATLLVLPAVVAGMVAAAQPDRFAAEVELLHQPEDNSTSESVDREMATHQVLLQQRPLLAETADAVGRSPEDLADSLTVEIVDGSSVLRLEVEDARPQRARESLNALVERYLESADRLAAGSDIGQLRALAPPSVLDEPVGPDALRAAAAGLLLGMVLVVALLALLRSRHGRSKAP